MSFGGERGVGAHSVEAVGSFDKHKADRRMMANLLHIDLSAILHARLISLSKNWIKRLLKGVRRLAVRDRGCNHILHALDWITGEGSCIQIRRCVDREKRDSTKDGLCRHAFDWE